MKNKRHTFLLSYICDDVERVYEFSAYSAEQAAIIARLFCSSHNAEFVSLELTCIAAAI